MMASICLAALAWRAYVLWSGAATFHSDEAVVGLMARHINQGMAIPIFFYGQPYMGSLDALLVAVMFRITGETILGIRLVQLGLYLAFVTTAMLLALRLFADRRVVIGTGLLLAFGTPMLTLYTTISLGGYGEVLLLGNGLLLATWEVRERPASWQRWALLGAILGLGWWTNALIVTYALPCGLWLLPVVVRHKPLRALLVALVMVLVFSAPWWYYNVTHQWESVRFLIGGFNAPPDTAEASDAGEAAPAPPPSIPDKLIGLMLIGVPGVVGARFAAHVNPWSPLGWLVVVVWGGLLILSALQTLRSRMAEPAPVRFLWLVVLTFISTFLASSFGVDATGRYLLPLLVPLTILLATQLRARVGGVVLVALIAWQVAGVVAAMNTPRGLSPQFDPITDIPNQDDQRLIAYLQERGLTRGYATYWVTFRLAFLSQERLIFVPKLPYKADLRPAGGDRYPPYTPLVIAAERITLISAAHPALDAAIEAGLRRLGHVPVQKVRLGPYTVYPDLPGTLTPAALGFPDQ
jgi:hypothetical protein